jgi:hypothetical protein
MTEDPSPAETQPKSESTPASRLLRWQELVRGIFGDWKFAGRGFLAAVIFGWFIELWYGVSAEESWWSSWRTFCLLWFASGAAFFAGAIGGFLFGVPKAVSSPTDTGRYKINTNLEEISDWATKIILGLGLVHVGKIIHLIDSIGQEVGNGIGQAQGAKIIAISAMIYGFVSGFLIVYIWTRTTLKRELEKP